MINKPRPCWPAPSKKKVLSYTQLSPTLSIREMADGWWLWDETRKVNLGMHAKTRDAAFVEALTYYQRRLQAVEANYAALDKKVQAFLDQFKEPDEDVE